MRSAHFVIRKNKVWEPLATRYLPILYYTHTRTNNTREAQTIWLKRAKKKKIAITIFYQPWGCQSNIIDYWIDYSIINGNIKVRRSDEVRATRVRYCVLSRSMIAHTTVDFIDKYSSIQYHTSNMVIVCLSIISAGNSFIPVSPHRICIHGVADVSAMNQ